MDEQYREQLDAEMGEELAKLEARARKDGHYCERHDHWIGEASGCPWCEIEELNKTCCPGDLKPGVVRQWPPAARRALKHFNAKLATVTAERDRLRKDLDLVRSTKVFRSASAGVWYVEGGGTHWYETLDEALDAAREEE